MIQNSIKKAERHKVDLKIERYLFLILGCDVSTLSRCQFC